MVKVLDGTGRWYGEGMFRWEPWVMRRRQSLLMEKHAAGIRERSETEALDARIDELQGEWDRACPELAIARFELQEEAHRSAMQQRGRSTRPPSASLTLTGTQSQSGLREQQRQHGHGHDDGDGDALTRAAPHGGDSGAAQSNPVKPPIRLVPGAGDGVFLGGGDVDGGEENSIPDRIDVFDEPSSGPAERSLLRSWHRAERRRTRRVIRMRVSDAAANGRAVDLKEYAEQADSVDPIETGLGTEGIPQDVLWGRRRRGPAAELDAQRRLGLVRSSVAGPKGRLRPRASHCSALDLVRSASLDDDIPSSAVGSDMLVPWLRSHLAGAETTIAMVPHSMQPTNMSRLRGNLSREGLLQAEVGGSDGDSKVVEGGDIQDDRGAATVPMRGSRPFSQSRGQGQAVASVSGSRGGRASNAANVSALDPVRSGSPGLKGQGMEGRGMEGRGLRGQGMEGRGLDMEKEGMDGLLAAAGSHGIDLGILRDLEGATASQEAVVKERQGRWNRRHGNRNRNANDQDQDQDQDQDHRPEQGALQASREDDDHHHHGRRRSQTREDVGTGFGMGSTAGMSHDAGSRNSSGGSEHVREDRQLPSFHGHRRQNRPVSPRSGRDVRL